MSQKSLTVWEGQDSPAPTPQLAQSMSPQDLQGHRGKICFEVEIVLSGYWQTFPAPEIKAGILADWADALQDWSTEQVVWALRKWREDNPNKRPNPGHISKMLKDARGKAEAERAAQRRQAEKPEEPNVAKVSPEKRAEIDAMVRRMFPTNRH